MGIEILLLVPLVCFAPCQARLTVRIDRDAQNRLLRIEWAEGATERQLDGAEAPRTWTFELKGLTEPQTITACVYDAHGKRRCDREAITVLAR